MRSNRTYILGITLVVFLAFAPSVAVSGGFAVSQEIDPGDIIETLLTEGAEIIYASVDSQGVPIVIYGQLGIPSEELQLTNEDMFGGCMALLLAGTRGEMMSYIFDLIGMNSTEGGGGLMALAQDYAPAQEGGLPTDITQILGTEFRLLISVYVNVEQAVSTSRMSLALSHLTTQFGFSFAPVFSLRIDENTFPPESGFTLPVDSLDVYIYQLSNDFASTMDAVFGVMSDTGFLGDINTSVFLDSRAAAAGVVAIPDVQALMDLIEGFTGNTSSFALSSSPFSQAQLLNATGPIAVAAAGYIGEQVVSSTSDSLGVAELVGASSLTPFDSGLSMVLLDMPDNANITSFSPASVNHSFYENESQLVAWNSTWFGEQSDYIVYFNEDDFPPMIELTRAFSANPTSVGGSTQVTVTVTNLGDTPITSLNLTDRGVSSYYDTITITGTTSMAIASLAPGASETMTYTVAFVNEGSYTFPGARLTYVYNANGFGKTTPVDGVVVSPNLVNLLSSAIMDGWPASGVLLAFVGLIGIYSIRGLFKTKPGSNYQV